MAPHSSTLAWKLPWTEEPDRLQSTGSRKVGHDWATSLSLSCTGEGNGNPLQCSCLENPRDWGAWWAAVYGVAQSPTRLERLHSAANTCSKGWLTSLDLCDMKSPLTQKSHTLALFFFFFFRMYRACVCVWGGVGVCACVRTPALSVTSNSLWPHGL